MKQNLAYQKAIRLLTHPLSAGAILLLLLNDLLFRQVCPSWLTGKLGDLAWLFFFPFALAVILAFLVPTRLERQAQICAWLAYGLTGAVFTLTKASPAFHAWLVGAASRFFGFTVSWRMDPSDLIALAALVASWWLWQRTPALHVQQARSTQRPAWLWLTLAALLTVANAAQPEVGVNCLGLQDGQVAACSAYHCYASQDGGLTWTSGDEAPPSCPSPSFDPEPPPLTSLLVDPADSLLQLRIRRGAGIDYSTDGGANWTEEYSLRPVRQAERAYYVKTANNNAVVQDPPLAALFDPVSGNAIFAMGHSGVLVRRADGIYQAVPVASFAPQLPSFGQRLLTVLQGEMILAPIFAGLCIASLNLPAKRHWLRMVALTLGWLVFGVTALIFSPAIQEGPYSAIFPQAGLLASGVLTLVLAGETLIRTGTHSGKQALRLGLLWIASGVLFFLPFLLWLANILPLYYLALGLGAVLGIGLLGLTWKKELA